MANSLCDIRDKTLQGKVTILSFNGHTLETSIGVFKMDGDTIFLNKEIVTVKEILKKISDLNTPSNELENE